VGNCLRLHLVFDLSVRFRQHGGRFFQPSSSLRKLFSRWKPQVADVQPAILNQFGEIKDLPWLGVAFALGGIAILPWYNTVLLSTALGQILSGNRGKAYGVFNVKWLYITTVLLFEVGSALCGAAPNMKALIVGRVIG